MNWASTDSPWDKTVTENIFGLHVKAIKTIVFLVVNFCSAIVGLTACTLAHPRGTMIRPQQGSWMP